MSEPVHEIELEVRDYECDIQGIVNNSVYMNYLEHARHKYIKDKGLDFALTAQAGIFLVVARAEIDYKGSLRSGDAFIVASTFRLHSPVRFFFEQSIYRLPDRKLMVSGKIMCAAISREGRLMKLPPEVLRLLG